MTILIYDLLVATNIESVPILDVMKLIYDSLTKPKLEVVARIFLTILVK